MELLTLLTLLYAAILVLALAASLLAILVYLRRIAGVLDEVRAELAEVQARTEPFDGCFQPLRSETGGAAEALCAALEDLEQADARLAVLAERHGIFTLES